MVQARSFSRTSDSIDPRHPSAPAQAGRLHLIVAQAGGPNAPPYPPARRVSFGELLGGLMSLERVHGKRKALQWPILSHFMPVNIP
jgi:hypothetical protein